jgi:hypothetical protein
MRLRLLLSSCLTLACATTGGTTTPETTEAAAPPDAGSDELATAFDPQPVKAAAAPVRPPEEPKVDRAAAYKSALADAQAALKAKKLDDARAAAQKATSEAATLEGEARFQAHQLATKVELTAANAEGAEAAARAWLFACGPEKLDACRTAALTALASAAKVKGADKKLAREVNELRDAELCAVKAEKLDKPAPCEATTLTLARRSKDEVLEQRLLLGQALREDDAPKQVRLLEKAEASCTRAQCSGLRRRALGKLIAQARSNNDVDGAVKLALREVQVIAETLPDDEKRWARTATLDQTCLSYDATHAVGACRFLEKKTLGRWTFHDYSREKPSGEGLSADQVRMVNDHFAPLLQECLAEQARRMMPPDAQRFEVRWVVFNDGRVGEAHLRRDLDQTPLAVCLRAQFAGWRYPRYEGEYQNVEQAFTVTANERRIR